MVSTYWSRATFPDSILGFRGAANVVGISRGSRLGCKVYSDFSMGTSIVYYSFGRLYLGKMLGNAKKTP